MSQNKSDIDTKQARWARFRFSVIGPLLASPPDFGALKGELEALASKQWRHPISGEPVFFSFGSFERWFYQARKEQDPVGALCSKRRTDSGKSRRLNPQLKPLIQQQYREHSSWSYQLHYDNLQSLVRQSPELGPLPAYHTIRRYMKANGCVKGIGRRRRNTPGGLLAAARLSNREVRSFEVEHVHALWHLDFHHGSLKILDREGCWHKPLLLAVLDDHSRLICHLQWYLDETVETLVHGFAQALQKRGLPRALMTDNGAAMMASEFTSGLERLGILHQPTLPYSPYQNAKQEVFWGQIEGRLLAMLENNNELTLSLLNEATLAWVEFEYHRKMHTEIECTPLNRYLKSPNVGRHSPDSAALRDAFCTMTRRRLRKSDLTLSLEGKRFEVPAHYRDLEELTLRYARWDLGHVTLVDPHTQKALCPLYPQDKLANASGLRRALPKSEEEKPIQPSSSAIAPLLKDYMAEFAATGLPPAYLPRQEKPHES